TLTGSGTTGTVTGGGGQVADTASYRVRIEYPGMVPGATDAETDDDLDLVGSADAEGFVTVQPATWQEAVYSAFDGSATRQADSTYNEMAFAFPEDATTQDSKPEGGDYDSPAFWITDNAASFGLPAGQYIMMEDITDKSFCDFDYNDNYWYVTAERM